ncbi:MAG TPA: hypothetical protein PKU97_19480 [Kofleriaceae bacterium]|nr:hypothetical protein [Kofleriaceae bacterium]
MLVEHAPLTPAEMLAWADAIRAMTPPDVQQSDSTDIIRAYRDSR